MKGVGLRRPNLALGGGFYGGGGGLYKLNFSGLYIYIYIYTYIYIYIYLPLALNPELETLNPKYPTPVFFRPTGTPACSRATPALQTRRDGAIDESCLEGSGSRV